MPRPRMEKGLTGTEKYPFLGKKNENDIPRSWDFNGEVKNDDKKNRKIQKRTFLGCIILKTLISFINKAKKNLKQKPKVINRKKIRISYSSFSGFIFLINK